MKKTFSILLILLITLCSFSSSYASNETLNFLRRINSAQTASQIRTLIEARDDIKFDLSSIYYKDNIYGGLVGQNFASMTELNNCAMGLTIAEESESKVALYRGSEQVTSLGTGDHKVVVAPLLKEGVKIVAATYKGDTLNTYDIKDGSTTQSTELSLGNMTGGETSKVIFLESLDVLKPLNSYELFYDDKIEIYVSPNGKANGDGSRANPFGSLEAAQSYVRTINSNMNCDIRVNVLPGDYYITEPLEFTEEDSGTNGYEIIWSGAYGDDLPMISGGVPVKEWSPYKDGIYKAHVDGVTEARQFYINGIPAQRAVSEGYYIGEMPYGETGDVKYTTPDIEPIELEFEVYAGYAVRDVDGKGVASHPWTLTNPDFEFTFEVPVGGYYDASYIAGFQSDAGSYSEVKLYVDGKLIGHNRTAGTLLEGYSYKYSDKITYSQQVHEFNTKKLLLSEGTHSFSVDFSCVVGGNWYTYLLDSISFTPTEIEQGFYLSGYDLPDFERPHELELVVPVLWAQQRLPVRDVIAFPDEDRHIFAMDMPYYHSYINMVSEGENQPDIGTWFYIENALELLDEPGEFWFDTANGDVYYYPHNSSELTAEAYIPVSEGLMSIKGASAQSKVSNIRFTGLDFRHGAYNELSDTGLTTFQADCLMPHDAPGTGPSGTGYTTPSQIHVEYADNIVIENCRMSNLGSAALGMTRGVTNSVVTNNVINDISATGIIVGSWRYKTTDYSQEFCTDITIDNNYIRRIGQEIMGTPAVGVYYAKNIDVSHNDIADTPYTGITVGWGWQSTLQGALGCGGHRIVGNRIDANSRMMRDGGAIYTNGKFASNGVYIAENYITDSPDFAAIYMDTGSSYITMEKNVVENVVGNTAYNWSRGTPYNGVIGKNYVMTNKHSVNTTVKEEDENGNVVTRVIATMEEPTVVGDGLWSGEAKEIADNAGLYASLRGLTECHERDEAFGTAYDWFGPNEVLGENDILIDCTDYNPGINVGYFAGYKEGEYLEPNIDERGKCRMLLSGFLNTMWYKYDIEVPVAGRYRVELRYSMGKASKSDTVYGYATVKASNNNGSNLSNIPLRGTETYFVSQPSVRLGELNLPKGSNTIMLLNSGGSWGFDNIKLIYIGD